MFRATKRIEITGDGKGVAAPTAAEYRSGRRGYIVVMSARWVGGPFRGGLQSKPETPAWEEGEILRFLHGIRQKNTYSLAHGRRDNRYYERQILHIEIIGTREFVIE